MLVQTEDIYQALDAAKFADMMLEREIIASHLDRETLAKCWVRGLQAAAESNDRMRPILACWFATGLVEGLLWAKGFAV